MDELEEDKIWNKILLVRDTETVSFVSHEDVWA